MKKKATPILLIFLFICGFSLSVYAAPHRVLDREVDPDGDGIADSWCDIRSSRDRSPYGVVYNQTLRHRLSQYNRDNGCFFYMFFTFGNKEIRLTASLRIKNNPHDRDFSANREVFSGTYISGYGTGGESDKVGITINALQVTENPNRCAFVLEGGLAARHQIHGLSIKVQSEDQAICDEDGNSLLDQVSSMCEGNLKARDCDFEDVTIVTQVVQRPEREPEPEPQPDPEPPVEDDPVEDDDEMEDDEGNASDPLPEPDPELEPETDPVPQPEPTPEPSPTPEPQPQPFPQPDRTDDNDKIDDQLGTSSSGCRLSANVTDSNFGVLALMFLGWLAVLRGSLLRK